MKFDIVIIGGGLAGLTAGISLEEKGLSTAIVSTGHSSLHFNTGSFGLLGYDADRKPVASPADAISRLANNHPYVRTGMASLAPQAAQLLADAGITMAGSEAHNHLRISSTGIAAPAWLTLEGMTTVENLRQQGVKRAAIVGIDGYLDFMPRFIASTLEKAGIAATVKSVTTDALRLMRKNESEMRAANISRILCGDRLDRLAESINAVVKPGEADVILFPAVVGSENPDEYARLRRMSATPLYYCATPGASVPGMIIGRQLTSRYTRLGGMIFKGDSVVAGQFDGDRLTEVKTQNLGSDSLRADNFIFAAGSFFSHAIEVLPDRIVEPALGLDIDSPADRPELFGKDLFEPQPFMKAGIATDPALHAMRGGRPVANLYVAGAALAATDSLSEASGSGVAMTSALFISNAIAHK